MNEFKVSVVIPCFNHGEFLSEAVASVTSIDRDDVELIVVDDGSTDHLTRSEMDSLSVSGIHVIRQSNKGLAAARNTGIRASSGKYILPLDADNRIRAAYLDHGIHILDAQPRTGVVYGDAQRIGIRNDRWQLRPFDPAELMQWNYIDACAIYRRTIWEQNGGYDGTMPMQGFEDWDFWLGALENGWGFSYVSEILFDYREAAVSMITDARRLENVAHLVSFIAKKHGALYRGAWLQLERRNVSGTGTLHNLRRLMKLRINKGLRRNGTHG